MRPVNLIPPEERRGLGAPTRTGRAPYIVVAALAALVVAFGALTVLNNSISDKEAEIASLEVEKQDAAAKSEALAPYAEFAAAHELRGATIDSLARSRFDWNRVLDELSRVIPADIWLVELAGSVSPNVSTQGGPSISSRGDVPGPALELIGCGKTHEAVAGLLGALRDIDGVTRATATSSSRAEAGGSTAAGAASGGQSTDCSARGTSFEIVAAFDEVAVPTTGGATPAPVTPAPSTPATQPVASEGGA